MNNTSLSLRHLAYGLNLTTITLLLWVQVKQGFHVRLTLASFKEVRFYVTSMIDISQPWISIINSSSLNSQLLKTFL
jgi:hypothetical protein